MDQKHREVLGKFFAVGKTPGFGGQEGRGTRHTLPKMIGKPEAAHFRLLHRGAASGLPTVDRSVCEARYELPNQRRYTDHVVRQGGGVLP